MRIKRIIVLFGLVFLLGCSQKPISEEKESMHQIISAVTAKEIMDNETGYIILDVREENEYEEKHIPNAIRISYTDIEEDAEKILTDKDQKILVYCRSGKRSEVACKTLDELGYTNIFNFGGILDWPYETE